MVDDEDYALASGFCWNPNISKAGMVYARTAIGPRANRHTITLHRLVLGTTVKIDHEDRNGLNCQKWNLRVCSQSQNMANRPAPANNTSGFKGVARKGERWRAYIGIDYRNIHIGLFDTPQEAAPAYANAALHHFGEFARTNQSLGLLT